MRRPENNLEAEDTTLLVNQDWNREASLKVKSCENIYEMVGGNIRIHIKLQCSLKFITKSMEEFPYKIHVPRFKTWIH